MAKSYAVFVLLFLILQPVVSRSTIKSLPGFEGRLPFELETGYVGVDESEDSQLFYYFIKSEKNPKEDPLMIWLTGGPGCSSASALFYEIDPKIFLLFASCVLQPSLFVGLGIGIYIYKVRSDNLTELSDETNGDSVYQYDQKAGPLTFKLEEYNGSLPTLMSVSYSWTKVASIIFLDSPVGSGFSYARTAFASQASDSKQVLQVDQFLRKWLMDHPQFLSNPFYVGGDSYSGIIVPAVVQQIQNRNEQGVGPPINLQGYLLGNPATNERSDTNYRIPFAHGMGLISDELYESLERNCGGEYFNVDPSHSQCLKDLEAYNKCVSGLNVMHILLAECGPDFAEQQVMKFEEGRYLRKTLGLGRSLPWFGCYTYPLLLSTYWANDENVRRALHVRKASIGKWLRCNTDNIPYTKDIRTSFQYHVNNSAKGLRSLIYSGDHDLMVPFLGTQAWIRALTYSIIDDWRPWMINDQIAGYTRTYANQMTFATIKGGAHTANYKPEECSVMFKRWINGEPL